MKRVGRFSKLLGYAVALATLLSFVASVEAVSVKGKIRGVRGTAQLSTDGSTFKPVRVGMDVSEKTTIKTAAEGTVDIFLGDNGPVVRVTPASTLRLDKLDKEETGVEKVIETNLDLRDGRILGNVKKLSQASKYEVKTPSGVAAIRGTEYDISASGAIKVYSGTVVMVFVSTSNVVTTVTITAGQSITAAQAAQAFAATAANPVTLVPVATPPPAPTDPIQIPTTSPTEVLPGTVPPNVTTVLNTADLTILVVKPPVDNNVSQTAP